GIVYGIDRPRIDAAFAAGHCERVAIAKGQAAQEGVPTRFETLYDKKDPSEEEDNLDRIRYTDLCHILVVNPGDKLMRRVPPVQGKNGTNIKGHAVLPKPTPDIPFRIGLDGVAPAENDPNLLVATTGGQPVSSDNGVTVNPVIEVTDVDLSTGSIEFQGTLRVGGDVKAGMHIKVSGDVIINGAMEAAQITAGGNVAVRGGIVGHPDSRPGAHSLPETTARIISEGSVQAMFMENAHIEAGKSILITRNARQCELIAREEIVVGKGKTGQIIGGKTQATQRIATGTLGASTGIKTYVQAGIDPYLEKQIADKDHEFKQKCDEVDRVVKLLVYFKHNPQKGAGGVAEKVEATRQQLLAAIDDLTEELKVLRAKVELAEQACVEVSGQIHYGVEVRIAQQMWTAPDDMGGATLELYEGRIAVKR
ncbi:MAG TPA: FapA family protein, partial [Noviherbaspirillum sp.]|nr:FapA family protein [Noviherbaspirillum sp.]